MVLSAKKIAKPKIAKALPRCLTNQQAEKLLLVSDSYPWTSILQARRNRAIIRTFLLSGIRLSELLRLKTAQVNLAERKLTILQGKGRKDRVVPVHHELYPFLKGYLDAKKTPEKWFFSSLRSDKPLTEKNLYAIVKKLRKACRFYFSPHMLRHTMAKKSIEANLNPFILQAILGHSDISTTQIYVALSSKNVVESFANLRLV